MYKNIVNACPIGNLSEFAFIVVCRVNLMCGFFLFPCSTTARIILTQTLSTLKRRSNTSF